MDVTCALAAAFFFASNLLSMVYEIRFRNRSHFDYASMTDFDPDYVQKEWEFRSDHRGTAILVGGLNAMAWLIFSIPVLQLSWILSKGGRRKIGVHITMAVLVLAGSFSEFMAWLFTVGTVTVSEWISRSFNLDNWLGGDESDMIGWRALELSHLVIRGLHMWIDAFEWLAMFGILILVHYSIKTHGTTHAFRMRWARIGLAIAALSIFDFASDVLRMQSWRTFSIIANVTSFLNTLILLPIWLIALGKQLPGAAPAYDETEEDDFVNKVENAKEAQEILEDIV